MPEPVETVAELVNPRPDPTEAEDNGYELASQTIKSKSYWSSFTAKELRDACNRLDQAMMLRHGYDDCQHVDDASVDDDGDDEDTSGDTSSED